MLEKTIAQILIKKKLTLAIAESCTGGLIAHRITNIPGSSRYFKLGLVTYGYEAKERVLKIPTALLRKKGAVSVEVTTLLAQRVRKLARADVALGVTGIAGPGGKTATKPLGLVFIALALKNKTLCKKFLFKGSRRTIKTKAATTALRLLRSILEKHNKHSEKP